MAMTRLSAPLAPQLALECGHGQLATPARLGWRERLLQLLNQIRWSGNAASTDAPVLVGYEALGGLDDHLLADIGAPESVRERARQCHDLQRQRVIDLEHGHRSIGDGRW